MARKGIGVVCSVVLLTAAAFGATAPAPATSLALRAANRDMLSGGLFSALDAAGAYGTTITQHAVRAGVPDISKGKPPAVLDPRVGPNVRIGDDPSVLPEVELGQVEPHIYRSSIDGSVLLATFQEGRLSDAGAVDCGYGVSTDGGFTWTRALIPSLTVASGGRFNRATDPVAAIGPQGDFYLNTLGSISGAFTTAAVVVSRSTDQGATWSQPVTVYESTSTQISPDKNWMVVNDLPGTPNAGRLVITWTNFTSTSSGASTGNNIMASVSDDRGATWSTPVAVTPTGAINQGSQPVFLPDGTLLVIYVRFPDLNTTSQFQIECKRSLDGGRTFPTSSTVAVPFVNAWDDPDLRDGVFLPSACVSRQSSAVFVTYTAVVGGTPRVFVTKSIDNGTSWSAPVVASDNPAASSVANPAVAALPDGQTVSVVFIDKRNASDGHNFMDMYMAQSLDGGTTWGPNVRLTERTSDIRYGPLTTRGYMFGDYLGIAPATTAASPWVAIWCDGRTGDSDPFTVRFLPSASPAGFGAWATVHGLDSSSLWADPDGDGEQNYFEYLAGTDPRDASSAASLYLNRSSPTSLDVDWVERTTGARMVFPDGVSIATLPAYTVGGFSGSSTMTANLAADQLPAITLPTGLEWRGTRVSVTAGEAYAAARSAHFSAGLPVTASRISATVTTASRLIDVSTRGAVGAAATGMIVGFVIDGAKTMLVRAAGPALTPFGVTDVLAAPQLTLNRQSDAAVLATNSGWAQSAATSTEFTRVGAFPFGAGSSDAAILQTLPGGNYTGVVTGATGAGGNALVEAYDADASPGAPSGPRILNLSTRANVVGGGSSTLIAGFVISGTQPRRILLRAVGPSLAQFSLNGTLYDPVLTLYGTGNDTAIAANDDWEISGNTGAIAATAKRIGAFVLNPGSLDASLLVTLTPGNYTATVTSVTNATGIALVEVYDAD